MCASCQKTRVPARLPSSVSIMIPTRRNARSSPTEVVKEMRITSSPRKNARRNAPRVKALNRTGLDYCSAGLVAL